jgi:hypothetical protein
MKKELVLDENSIKYEIRDKISAGDFVVDIPAKYRGKVLSILFPASTKKMKKFINCPGVVPAEIFWGKSLLSVTLFDFSESPVGPYTELDFATPISYKPKIKIPLLPLIKDQISKKYNLFIFDIVQSTEIAIKHGNILTGYPHNPNLIDVIFEENDKGINVKSYGSNKNIIDVHINKPKKEKIINESYFTYFVKDNIPHRIKMDIYAIGGNVKIDKLNLGDHKIAELIKNLGTSLKPFQVRYSRDVIEINPVTKEKL